MILIIKLIHVAVCIALILIVLLQRGKGQSMGAAFGGSSQTVFGSSGATSFLQKLTTASAIIFMLTSLSLAFFFGKGTTNFHRMGMSSSIRVCPNFYRLKTSPGWPEWWFTP